MLKVLIVDDNAVSRTSLKTMMEWECHGFTISGEASNGMDAIQVIEQELPDVVITDMNMPIMDGIGLIEYMERQYPDIRLIALSAYDDFDYVRQSLKRGAMDYVLKHRMDASLLLEVLKAAENSILASKCHRERQNELYHELTAGKAALVQQFLRRLLEGSMTDRQEILKTFSDYDIRLDTAALMVTVIEIDDFRLIEEKFTPKEMNVLIQTFLDISGQLVRDWEPSWVVHAEKGKFAIIFAAGQIKSRMYLYNRIYELLNRIRSEIKKYLNITVCSGVSKVWNDVLQLPLAYNEAKSVLKDKFYAGKNSIFIESTCSEQEDGFYCLDIKEEKAIYAALRNLDEETASSLVNKLFDNISQKRISSKSTQIICAELINMAGKICKETGMDISEVYTTEEIPFNRIQKYETLTDIRSWILNLFHKLIAALRRMKWDGPFSGSIQKAIAFIHRNYRTDVSLKDVADYAGVSSSHFSRLFKEECRMGFAEYLNHVRIEHAKLDIEQGDYKLKEIVSRAGFNHYNYFFKVFKEVTGMTPQEYEQACKTIEPINKL
ncbi:response regulator transcription factor [Paenibacillus humicola]|uniref:response regulator transcription factor n=1 Tax=Paenibacillus humicola TaxID=3110540 RepID=UPI00237A54AE|nr:response regulator [Paenibacillus humicola]